jgi:small-conductance mechanosensitive channel
MLGFIAHYSRLFILLMLVMLFFHLHPVMDAHLAMVLYLLAIPCLLYMANRFIHYFNEFNAHHDHLFLAKDFQRRFIMVFSTLTYATIVIFFFRQAFLLGHYPKSELPTILLAINFIIFQISLIFLIAKEHILSIIPVNSGDFWKWVAVQVDRFYYLILMLAIVVIVMSNPYVGFGRLVLAVLTNVLYTIILLRLLLWVNGILKRGLSYVFFSRGADDFMRERFAYGKTLYGICAVVLLFFFITILLIGGAKIWSWPDTFANINHWSDVVAWLKEPILLDKSEHPISTYSILKILFFVLVGFFLSFWIDRFVIERIFDALLVEPGVQNTISSMVRYIIVIMAVIVGFQSVGLGELVIALLGALIIGIGWVVKEPLGDFIAYFIILVQRPVKIGDFIRLEEGTEGVVRKITARSVVLRRRNSVTIILPNSTIINKPLINWNYVRGFVAFEDIRVLVSYKEDPAKVKSLLLTVLDEHSLVLKTPNPIVRLENFDEQGFDFLVRGYVSSNYTLDIWEIASDVRLAIVKKLREHGMQIALPTRIMINKETFFNKDNPTSVGPE